jgi:hypothetical protein
MAERELGMTEDTRHSLGLTDRTGFWLAMAVVLATVGSVAIVVAITEYHKPWTSAWFITGVVVCGLGCISSLWALVLYIADRMAGNRGYADPYAPFETGHRQDAIVEAGSHTEPVGWLLPVLRQFNGDLRRAAAGIEDALSTGSYAGLLDEFRLQAWEANQDRLATLEGCGDLFDSLQEGYRHVARVRRILVGTPEAPWPARPRTTDDLGPALVAIHRAEAAVTRELADLDRRAPRRTTL